MSIYEKATTLQRQGNWAGYGEELRKLEQVLKTDGEVALDNFLQALS